MDDIMILLHRFVIDIQGFNTDHFWIFDEHERSALLKVWESLNDTPSFNPTVNRFLSVLSPSQRHKMVEWGIGRTSYDVQDVIQALEKFTTFLKSSYNPVYSTIYPLNPKKKQPETRVKHKSIFRR
jgi:hypothetical protein